MLNRVLESEVMDSEEEAQDYDAMDHRAVNRLFASDFQQFWPSASGNILDVGTGTAQIPIEICKLVPAINFVGIDLAQAMLNLGLKNVHKAGLQTRIRLQLVDAKKLPFEDEKFAGVISNSIVHHIPKPRMVLKEIVRVVSSGGVIFIRDLLRPHSEEQVQHLVKTYAGDANAHQQKMFADSLRAALSLQEIQAMVNQLGFPADSVGATSDRHWTWAAKKNC